MTKSRSQQVFDHAQKFATPFRTSLGYPWAVVPDGPDHYRGFAVSSPGFRQWLMQSFHSEYFIYPGSSALETAIRMFRDHARSSEFPEGNVFTRLGWRGDRRFPRSIFLHLANPRNEMVEMTPKGHRTVSADSWRFLSHSGALPLARPIDNTTTLRQHLRRLLNIDDTALDRSIVWLFAALRPCPPYPILAVSGPPASGKSLLVQILRCLIDPSALPVLDLPPSEHLLFAQALHNHVLAYDRLESLPHSIADPLARLASGAGVGCTRYDGEQSEPLALARPIIMTAPASDLPFTDNVLRIELAARKPESMLTESKLAENVQDAAPAILGTLCAAVTAALANAAVTQAPPISRLVDLHRWTMAAAPLLGLTSEQVNCALAGNPLVDVLNTLLQNQREWTGTAADLFKDLQSLGSSGVAKDAQHLSEQLNAPILRLFGIDVRRTDAEIRLARISQGRGRQGRSGTT